MRDRPGRVAASVRRAHDEPRAPKTVPGETGQAGGVGLNGLIEPNGLRARAVGGRLSGQAGGSEKGAQNGNVVRSGLNNVNGDRVRSEASERSVPRDLSVVSVAASGLSAQNGASDLHDRSGGHGRIGPKQISSPNGGQDRIARREAPGPSVRPAAKAPRGVNVRPGARGAPNASTNHVRPPRGPMWIGPRSGCGRRGRCCVRFLW